MSKTFIYDKHNYFEDDYYVAYRIYKSKDNWYGIEKLCDQTFETEKKYGDDDSIFIKLEEFKETQPKEFALLEFLVILSNTNCGHCGAPYITEDMIQNISRVLIEYNNLTGDENG